MNNDPENTIQADTNIPPEQQLTQSSTETTTQNIDKQQSQSQQLSQQTDNTNEQQQNNQQHSIHTLSNLNALQKNEHTIPHNIIIEQSILGALLLNNEVYEQIAEFLLPAHFYTDLHKKIYTNIKSTLDSGSQIDPMILAHKLDHDNDFKSVNGVEYLFKIAEGVISITSTHEYAQIIYDLYLRRQLLIIGDEISNKINHTDKAINIIRQAEEVLYKIAQDGESNKGLINFTSCIDTTINIIEKAYKNTDHINGITTGFKDLDNYLGGLNRSDLVIVAGRPSMGKTAFATNIAFNAAFAQSQGKPHGAKVAFFSLEMSDEQLTTRILASACEIASHKIKRGEITADEFTKFKETAISLKDLNLFIDDTPGISIPIIRSRARKLKRTKGLDLIIIDYLQLLQSSSAKISDNRVQEISEITRSLKVIAKELDVPVIALSQLSRAVEARDDKRPQLADLRESGSIEQDADVVMFVYRDEYYLSRSAPEPGTQKYNEWLQRYAQTQNTAEILLAKQRHGPIGTVKLFFDGRFTKFGDLISF